MSVLLEMHERGDAYLVVVPSVEAAKALVESKASLWRHSKRGRRALVDKAGMAASFFFSDGKLYGGMFVDPLPPPHQPEPFDNRRRPKPKPMAPA